MTTEAQKRADTKRRSTTTICRIDRIRYAQIVQIAHNNNTTIAHAFAQAIDQYITKENES